MATIDEVKTDVLAYLKPRANTWVAIAAIEAALPYSTNQIRYALTLCRSTHDIQRRTENNQDLVMRVIARG